MRGSTLFAGTMLLGIALFVSFLGLHPRLGRIQAARARERGAAMVRTLAVTDLCLFTETPYTRHPAVTDRHAPFRDHPMALERFPSGALMPPPPHLFRAGYALD
jgi:hypothetical protein